MVGGFREYGQCIEDRIKEFGRESYSQFVYSIPHGLQPNTELKDQNQK